jgi:hypothetical protein
MTIIRARDIAPEDIHRLPIADLGLQIRQDRRSASKSRSYRSLVRRFL